MAMECLWDLALAESASELPEELRQVIQHGTNEQYLGAITVASLDARYTDMLFVHCQDVYAHICAILPEHGSLAATLATLGRVVPFAPYLARYAERALNEAYDLGGDHHEDLRYLLGLYRLLRYDHRTFIPFARPKEVTSLLISPNRAIVYMAIRVLQIFLDGADAWFERMIERYLGKDTPESEINGQWDNKVIDYRFLTLWEEQRYEEMEMRLQDARRQRSYQPRSRCRSLVEENFHPSCTLIGSILLPRSSSIMSPGKSELVVRTATIASNLRAIAEALKLTRPLLLTGVAGSGKTLLVRHVAQKLGKLDEMVTLHLNEQSDAKLLVGVHTSGDTLGAFAWKPGVLTTAVQEGRWLLIEDLDRAPTDVVSTLLGLVERRELYISSQKRTIYAKPGFRILATVRSNVTMPGEKTKTLSHMVGRRHWVDVAIAPLPADEQRIVALQLFPALSKLLPQLIAVYERLQVQRQQALLMGQSRIGILRPINPRDLLKWCGRIGKLLDSRATFTSGDMDDIFLEAVDCFVGALPDSPSRSIMAELIAVELHIDPQRRDYLLSTRDINYELGKSRLNVGRYTIARARDTKSAGQGSFSMNRFTSRMLERVIAAVVNREPLLLVGETGVGKTTAVQHLANHLGKKLIPFNLSQQSEAGDLLGGFKPVNARSMIVPMKDEFDELFAATFSYSKNQHFLDLLGKQMSRGNWKAVCKLWHQSFKLVDQVRSSSPARDGEAPSKKRKVESKKVPDFARWDALATKVEDMERRLAAGSEGFAFSFVEGNIVKAVRNGDWVLLDEINLASSDTLESIVDIFDPSEPSLLLMEAGNIERIRAHPDFRVFAAMNPATDVGKKDLPPSIRSRFTELYVESPDKDLKSLQSIVRSYLRREATIDEAIALDVSTLYQQILGLAEQNKLVDGAGKKPHFSLRSLTRTLSYAKYLAPMSSLRRALYEGFQMSFLTFLDMESARLLQPLLEQCFFGKRTNVRSELKKSLRTPNDGHHYILGYPGSKYWVRRGDLDLEEQPHYIITSFIRFNLENLARAASARQFPVLIQGPTSSGKTSMIEYLARRTGHKFVRINNHEHTDLQEYLGTYVSGPDGRLQFQEGVLVRALREGHWIVLDELNLAPTDVLEALNRLLDDNRELSIPETQQVVRPHESFMLFATQNPAGLYGGRKTLSRAFRNRFLELHFDDIPVDELQEILHKRTQLPESRCKRIVGVYRELSVLRQENRIFEQKSFATLRDLFRWALRPNDTIEQLAEDGFMLLAERVRKPGEREAIKSVIENVMSASGPRIKIDEEALYSERCNEIQLFQHGAKGHGVVWTRSMRRLFVLVSRAIKNDEPVLLVGETGCGKTTVCQMLADAFGKKLNSINAHQNTETGDLIGSQRPVRHRVVIEAQLRHQLLASRPLQSFDTGTAHSTDALLEVYDRALATLASNDKQVYLQTQSYADVQASRTRFKALFEWADGSLVQAMKSGVFFLLDEISLAEDSVLERINSVLEPQRSILLAEKGSLDAGIQAAPGFEFFATMNPGGDYGKRELSPALRNRFTEIWVPSLSETEDVVQIVQAKLTSRALGHANAMVQFSQWFKDKYNTSASSSISIRDALAWVDFVNIHAGLDVRSAIVHGAAMVYIDTLGANPAGLMTLSGRSLDEDRRACLGELGRVLGTDVSSIYDSDIEVDLTEQQLVIGNFALAVNFTGLISQSTFSFDAPTTRNNAMRVVRALQLTKPVMLEGRPGVGKTALVTAIAEAVRIPLTRINLSEQTDIMDLFGSDAPVDGAETGTFTWRDAPFLRAMKTGEWVLLDEMNLASQSVLEGLNACLDHRGEVYVPETGQKFTRHPKFKLFAAQNSHHQGGGRKGLPASFVNRFTVVYADPFRADDLTLICQRAFSQVNSSTIEHAVNFVDKLDLDVQHRHLGTQGGPWEFNLRDTLRWMALISSDERLLPAGNARDFVDLLFTRRFRTSSDRAYLIELLSSSFPDTPTASDSFCSITPLTMQVGLGFLPRQNSAASPARRVAPLSDNSDWLGMLQSLMICVQKSWPVIIAGPSGAGKTSLVEGLAAAVGASLKTVAMDAETDVMDLIGGYEQSDVHPRALQALADVRIHLQELAKSDLSESVASESIQLLADLEPVAGTTPISTIDLSSLISRISRVLPTETDHLRTLQDKLSVPADKARFEWTDGVLVDALEQGKWLVLDNANLCSTSVLDRLNSLLEPSGSLIINEHTGTDGAPRVVHQHPGFRIFMTVDPRYGELSRAMRNRAVELFLLSPSEEAEAKMLTCDPLHPESSVARFRHGKAFRAALASSLAPEKPEPMELVFRDHLSLRDERMLARFEQQSHAGLYGGVFNDSTGSISPSAEGNDCLSRFRELAVAQQLVSIDFACVQTLHPLNNQPFIQQTSSTLITAMLLAFSHDLFLLLTELEHALASISSKPAMTSRLSHVKCVILTNQRRPQKITSGNGLVDMVRSSMRTLWKVAERAPTIVYPELPEIKRKVQLTWGSLYTVLEIVAAEHLDIAAFAVCVLVSRHHDSSLVEQLGSSSTLKQLAQPRHDAGICSNHAHSNDCFTMWQALRPHTPATLEQLGDLLALESLADRFDQACQEYQLPLPRLAELRVSFSQALSVAKTGDAVVPNLLEKLSTLLPDNIHEHSQLRPSSKPHFVGVFRLLHARIALLKPLHGSTVDSLEYAGLEILAQRETKRSLMSLSSPQGLVPERQAPQVLTRLGLILEPADEVGASSSSTVEESLLERLKLVHQVTLKDLSLLESESHVLGKIVANRPQILANDSLDALDTYLKEILFAVLSSLNSVREASGISVVARSLRALLNDSLTVGGQEGEDMTDLTMPPDLEPSDAAVASLFRRTTLYFRAQHSSVEGRSQHASEAWSSLALAGLQLYLPDGLYDPAMQPIIQRDVHRRIKRYLDQRLMGVRAFRASLTGEETSLRTRMLELDIQYLGPEPPVAEVCRPTVSELPQIQTDLDGLRRILDSLPNAASGLGVELPLDATAWLNVRRVRRRLTEQHRSYTDFTTPVVGFLDCLAVAQELALRAARMRRDGDTHSALPCITPFSEGSLESWKSDDEFCRALSRTHGQHERLFVLSVLAARGSFYSLSNASTQLRDAAHQQFAWFFERWKSELSQDQRQAAAESSFFRYAGDIDVSDEASLEGLNELFPRHDEEQDVHSNQPDTPQKRAQDLAPAVAKLHRAVFTQSELSPERILELLESFAHAVPHGPCDKSLVPGLAVLVQQLCSLSATLSSSGESRAKYNIYTDANLQQAKRLRIVLRTTVTHFREIHNAWPEHATPLEVLRLSDNLLEYSHTDPLTRYLPVIEQLHSAVTEWQMVASKEYSAANLLEELIEVTVSWRRLELSSWTGLFDREDARCDDEVASWWYVAYEAVVAATQDVQNSALDLQRHTSNLLAILEGFIKSSGLGEYSARLSILRNLEAQLRSLTVERPSLATVRQGLANFIAYFSHYELPIAEALAVGRAGLEKEIKDVIKLASWKDRNIDTLRQSAKASHKKLLRLVRKYRILLAQPVSPKLQAGFPGRSPRRAVPATTDPLSSVDRGHTETGAEVSIRCWTGRPDRFRNVAATVALLHAKSRDNIEPTKGSARLQFFLSELELAISELQRETPSVLTEDNTSQVRHLKTRKRRLLAEVLKDVRSMGFQSNLSQAVLAAQESLPLVLTTMSHMDYGPAITAIDMDTADYHLYRLLSIMPSVRESARKHSDDLNPAETARCLAYLESMLRVSLNQRILTSSHQQKVQNLQDTVSKLHAFAAADAPVAARNDVSAQRVTSMDLRLLSIIIKASSRLVQMQASLGERHCAAVQERLYETAGSVDILAEQLSAGAVRSIEISYETDVRLQARIKNMLHDLSRAIAQWAEEYPEFEHVLSHVLRWTATDCHIHSSSLPNDSKQLSSDGWVQQLMAALDQILGSVEAFEVVITEAASSATDDAWLLKQQKELDVALAALRVDRTAHELWSLALGLCQVNDTDRAAMSQLAAVLRAVYPILQAYARAAEALSTALCKLYSETASMAYFLSKSFIEISSRGFCMPQEKEQGNNEQVGKVESGTGLGEGEGGKDISEDFGANEDLSELAQESGGKEQGDELKYEKDAVDMADEQMEGDAGEGDAGSKYDGSEDEHAEAETELEEEAGHVGDSDPYALDDKMWDEGKLEDQKDKEADSGKGSVQERDLGASNDAEAVKVDDADKDEVAHDEADDALRSEEVGFEDMEQADPQAQSQGNLDLPEDIDVDGKTQDKEDLSDLGSLSDDVVHDDFAEEPAMQDDGGFASDVGDDSAESDAKQDGADNDAQEAKQHAEMGEDIADDQEGLLQVQSEGRAQQDLDPAISGEEGSGRDQEKSESRADDIQPRDQDASNNDETQQEQSQAAAEGRQGTMRSGDTPKAAQDAWGEQQSLPYQQLGDVLEEWYRQHRQIEASQACNEPDRTETRDINMGQAHFEHLEDEDASADTQALGTGPAEQAQALDEEHGLTVHEDEADDLNIADDLAERTTLVDAANGAENPTQMEPSDVLRPEQKSRAFVGEHARIDAEDVDMADGGSALDSDEMRDVEAQLIDTHISHDNTSEEILIEEARNLWLKHESNTRNLALMLTEHLRLILEPTQATKMRGDFRTGKRLNIKRIIPYIASSYKRDKIWMRRSVPSKRSYQIMLAIDDSKSMAEGKSKDLAFDTLALMAKSMSMLEVGELCVIGFGEDTNLAHDFSIPFTTETGAEVFRHFRFAQSRTNVRKLLVESIKLFRAARLKAFGSASDLWQLLLIISDGVCEDHPRIRQLVRQAYEERIMAVFIVVDATVLQPEDQGGHKQSILDLHTAQFIKDEAGEMQLKMVKYLDTFPFSFYLIVRDVQELPGVLAGALRQWFSEIVESE